jgi:hypothetical protein
MRGGGKEGEDRHNLEKFPRLCQVNQASRRMPRFTPHPFKGGECGYFRLTALLTVHLSIDVTGQILDSQELSEEAPNPPRWPSRARVEMLPPEAGISLCTSPLIQIRSFLTNPLKPITLGLWIMQGLLSLSRSSKIYEAQGCSE